MLHNIFVVGLVCRLPDLFGARAHDLEGAPGGAANDPAVAAAFPENVQLLRNSRGGLPRTAPVDSLAARCAADWHCLVA